MALHRASVPSANERGKVSGDGSSIRSKKDSGPFLPFEPCPSVKEAQTKAGSDVLCVGGTGSRLSPRDPEPRMGSLIPTGPSVAATHLWSRECLAIIHLLTHNSHLSKTPGDVQQTH